MKTAKTILSTIRSWGRGKVFFYSDFDGIYGTEAVRQQMSRLCRSGEIMRCGVGIFYYPVIDTTYGLGVIPPTNKMIAEAYAEKQGIMILPTKETAQNILGLSTQNQLNVVYLTDGNSRTIDTGIGSGIRFIHTSQSRLRLFRSKEMRLLAIALIGEKTESVTEQEKALFAEKLKNVTEYDYQHDIKLFSHEKQEFVRQCKKLLS